MSTASEQGRSVMRLDREALPTTLREAPIPAEVERRIIAGALARRRGPETRPALRAVLVLAGAAAVLAGLWLLGAGQRPVRQERLAPGAGEAPVGTEWSASTRSSQHLGPHRLELEPRARLRLAAGTARAPRLALAAGRARFRVAKLAAGEGFTVETRQARVSVLGTVFTVDAGERCTRVEVARGRVVVAASGEERVLGAGEERSFCGLLPGTPSQSLDEEGRLVRRAIGLATRGENLAEAESTLTAYLAREPRGLYAEEAHYLLVLVLRRLGKETEAVAQARHFVERFRGTERAAALRRWLTKGSR
jgi:ferric-dicitrate binding protein FerR (iron transport regulator)